MEMSYNDFDPNKPGDNGEWTEVTVGKPKEDLALLEIEYIENEGYAIIAMSNRRNIYKSLDEGVNWEFDHRAGYREYWGKRIKSKWTDLIVMFGYVKMKVKLYQLRLMILITFNNIKLFCRETWRLIRESK